jgi:hypothetical protein
MVNVPFLQNTGRYHEIHRLSAVDLAAKTALKKRKFHHAKSH